MHSIKERNPWSLRDVAIYILLVFMEVLFVWAIIALLSLFGWSAQVSQATAGLPQGYTLFFFYLLQTLFFGLPLLILMFGKRIANKKESCLWRTTEWYNIFLVAPATYVVTIVGFAILFSILSSNSIDVPGFTGEKTKVVGEFGTEAIGHILAFIAAVLIAPLIEEIVFRGFMLRAFAKHIPVWGAVFGSSALFAAIHVTPGVFFPLMILGAVMATLTVKTKSIYPAIVFHMMNNSMAFLAEIASQYMPTEQVRAVITLLSGLWM